VHVTGVPGDARRVIVSERFGRIRAVRAGRRSVFADLRRVVEVRDRRVEHDQGGLLSLAFAPDYARSRRVYVLYTGRDDAIHVDEVRGGARRVVLTVPRDANVDVAGHIAFGPDRLLYVGVANGRTRETAQELDRLTGKLLRIDPRRAGERPYSVPADNPFVGRPDARPEIWAYGLRVPWRFSFDRLRGDLALGDVGESSPAAMAAAASAP
jgi:glucose/arabinose dehydrogenase